MHNSLVATGMCLSCMCNPRPHSWVLLHVWCSGLQGLLLCGVPGLLEVHMHQVCLNCHDHKRYRRYYLYLFSINHLFLIAVFNCEMLFESLQLSIMIPRFCMHPLHVMITPLACPSLNGCPVACLMYHNQIPHRQVCLELICLLKGIRKPLQQRPYIYILY